MLHLISQGIKSFFLFPEIKQKLAKIKSFIHALNLEYAWSLL